MTSSYSDGYRFALIDIPAPIFGAWLLLQGFTGGGPVSILFGLAVVGFTLFKRHRRYDLCEDALVVSYLAPRVLAVYLREIEGVQVMRQPIVGLVLVIQRKTGPKLIIRPKDAQEMESRLNAVLAGLTSTEIQRL